MYFSHSEVASENILVNSHYRDTNSREEIIMLPGGVSNTFLTRVSLLDV